MKTKYVVILSVSLGLIALYIYFRSEAQKKGWHKDRFWANLYGVAHYTEAEADTIAGEFENILNNPFPEDADGWTS